MSRRSQDRCPPGRTALAVLAACVVLVAATTVSTFAWLRSLERAESERAAGELVARIERRMEVYLAMLRGAAGLFAADEHVDRAEFRRFVRRLRLNEYPGIQGIGWSRRLAPDEAERVVAEAHASGLPSFELWPDRPRRPSDAPPERHAIVYLEPLDVRNRAALGYDMSSERVRRDAMERARDTGRVAVSRRVVLVQEIVGRIQPGFLVYLPVYDTGGVPNDAATRRATLDGFVYAPFRAHDLLQAVLAETDPPIRAEIFDGPVAREGERLFGEPLGHGAVVTRADVGGRTWTVRVTPRPGGAPEPWVVALIVAALGLALSLLVYRATRAEAYARRRAVAQRLAAEAALETEARNAQFRETFVGVLGHDLRSPLAAITASASFLQAQGDLCATQHRAVARIAASTERAARMVSQLLDITRARLGGGIPIERQTVAIDALVIDSAEELQSAHPERNIETHAEPGLLVEGDRDRLAQVLSNLGNNAVTHGAEDQPVRIEARRDDGEIAVRVWNAGAPIPPDVASTLFDPFVRGPASQRTSSGLGLGLYISQQIAHSHSGRIEVRSSADEGTTFELRLPRRA